MKKRILSVLLAVLIIFSSMPMTYADSLPASGTADNPYLISSKDDFKKFLLDASNTASVTYYKFTNDIVLDYSDDYITGAKCKNIVLDGNGYYIKGASFINAMFSELNNSTIKNVNFYDCYTISSESVSHVALLAQKCNDIDSYVTNCTFTECYIQFSYGGNQINSGFVAAENRGTITNCIVKDSLLCEDFSEGASETKYNIGGIVGKNLIDNGFGVVANCIVDAVFDLEEFHSDSSFGGIANKNQGGWIKNCYSEAKTKFSVNFNEIVIINNNDGYVSDCYYKKDGKFYLYGSDSAKESNAYILAATLSKAASTYNDDSIDFLAPDNYACMWTVKEYKENLKTVQELDLSYDGKTAVVLTYVDKNFYNSEDTNSVNVSVTDKTGFSVFQEDENGNPSIYAVKVGSYGDAGYKRNTLTVEFVLNKDYSMINDISQSPTNASSKKIVNVFDEHKNNYSTIFYTPVTTKDASGLKSTFTIDVLPVNGTIKISTGSSGKVVSDYCFRGVGNEKSPFIITNEYELRCLSNHVKYGLEYTNDNQKCKFSKAHYKLVADIKMSDEPFTPIGLNSDGGNTHFEGVFDGGSHTISNLVIDSTIHQQGLFGSTQGQKVSNGSYSQKAVIKNLNVFDVDIKEKDTSNPADIKGIIVGRAEGTVVKGCVTNGTISGGTQIAGVVGYAYYSDVLSCGSIATVNGYSPKAWVGGVVANAGHSKVENCYFAGTVNAKYILDESFVELGSIVAYNKDSVFNNNYYKDNCLYMDSVCKNEATTVYGTLENESTLKSDNLMNNLSEYSLNNNHQVYWKKVAGINSDYPINCSADEAYHNIYCVPTTGGVVTTNVSKAKAGETITVSDNNSYNELLGIKVYDTHNELISEQTNVVDKKVTFTMPACSVNVVPIYDEALFPGLGTENAPFLIYSYEDLVLLSDVVYDNTTYYLYDYEGNATTYYYNSAHYAVVNDIDCDSKEMYPIGHQSASFRKFAGVFDGQGYCISNLNIVRRDTGYDDTMGLFSIVENATIKNLDLRQVSVDYSPTHSSHKRTVSVLGGYFTDSNLINISIYDCLIKNAGYAGVLCTDIRGDVSFENVLVDGITFESCNTVSLISDEIRSSSSGGVFSAKNCVFMNISGVNNGVYRANSDSSELYAPVFACENNFYQTDIDIPEDNVINALAKTNAELLSDKFVADLSYYAQTELNQNLWGKNSSKELGISINKKPHAISKIFYDNQFKESNTIFLDNPEDLPTYGVEGQNIRIKYNIKFSLADLVIKADNENILYSTEVFPDEGYGYISFIMPESYITISNSGKAFVQVSLLGHGVEADPYLVSDYQDLLLIDSVLSGTAVQNKLKPDDPDFDVAYFRVTQDINVQVSNWNGIGYTFRTFKGVFDGNEKTINIPSSKGPLFEYIQGGTVKNLTLKGQITYSGETEQAGAVANYADNATISNVFSYVGINCGYIYTEYSVGCIIGYGTNNTVIEKCMNFGNISVKNADTFNQQGGIAGELNDSKVINCANHGAISGSSFSRTGGIVGYFYENSVIANSYNYGNVSGSGDCGAIAGYVKNSNVNNISNNYYLVKGSLSAFDNVGDSDTTAVSKTKNQFTSGEVTWLLNKKRAPRNVTWKQNLAYKEGEVFDLYPLFKGELVTYFEKTEDAEAYYYGIDLDSKMNVEDDGNKFNLPNKKYTNIELLGVQKKDTGDKNSIRFISVAKTELLQKAESYGYTYLATKSYTSDALKEKAEKILTVDSSYATIVDSKETNNTIAGDYGVYDADTNYKYITGAIENIGDNDVVFLARFYITINGETYYSYYTDGNNDVFDGCACSYNQINAMSRQGGEHYER